MKKRIACLLLALVMLVGLIPATAIPAKAAATGISEAGIRVIKECVGFEKNAYKVGDYYFIGYGTIAAEGQTITEANADRLLRDELQKLAESINAKVPNGLVQNRLDAMIWFSYVENRSWLNDGDALLNAVRYGTSNGSAFANLMCTWGYGPGFPAGEAYHVATIQRRLCMANMYLNGSYSSSSTGPLAYTVFDAGEGAVINGTSNRYAVQAYNIYDSEKAAKKAAMAGATFLGWYLDGSAVSGLNSATAGKTLSAKWQTSEEGVEANYQLSAEVIYTASGNKDSQQVQIYQAPSTSSTVIDILNRQTTVTVVREKIADAAGNKWLKLSTGGWVLLGKLEDVPASLTNLTVTVTDDYVNVRQSPSATSAKLGTIKRGEQRTITMISNDTKWGYCYQGWIFLAYTDYAGNSSPATSNGVASSSPAIPGTVTGAARVNVRTGPGVGNALATTLAEGTAVTVYEQTTADGAPWGRIDQGWISLGYVKLQQVQKPADGSSITAGSSAVVSSSVRLNVRTGPGTTYSVVSSLAPGTSVVILRKQTVGGATWGLIDQGWINLSYVSTAGISSSEGSSVYSVGGTVVNCSTGVNIRAAAGPANALIGVAGVGTRVNVTEITEVNGYKWGHIERGWVCMDYVQLDSEFKKPEPTVPNVVEDEPSNVVSTFEGYPAVISNAVGAQLRETASAHANSLLTLRNGAEVNIMAWYKTNQNTLYGKVTVGDKIGWVSLNDLTMKTFNAKVTAAKVDVYEEPSTRSKFYAALVNGTYVTVKQTTDNANWKISDGALWGKIEPVGTTPSGWIQLKNVTMFRDNIKPAGITSYSGVGYLTGTINTVDVPVLKDQNGSPVYLTDENDPTTATTAATSYTLTKGTRVNIQARSYYNGTVYGKVTVGSVAGWINMTAVDLDAVAFQANTTVSYFANDTQVPVWNSNAGTVGAGTKITITDRKLVRDLNEVNHGVIDAGFGYIGDNTFDTHWFNMDDGKLTPMSNAAAIDPSNPVIASSVVLTGKAIGDVYIREDTIDSTDPGMVNLLLKVSNGSPITVLNWKYVDGITWGKVQINKVVGWVKAAEVNFSGLKGRIAVDELKLYNTPDTTSAVQILRVNGKPVEIVTNEISLTGNILWGKVVIDSTHNGWIDLSKITVNTPGIAEIPDPDPDNLPVMAKAKINSVNVTVGTVEGQVQVLPKGTEVNLIELRMSSANKAEWKIDLGNKDSWVDMDCLNMYSAVATITESSAPIYDDLTLNKTLYTLYRDEKVTVLSFRLSDLGHPGIFKLYGEVAYGNTTGWILLCREYNADPNVCGHGSHYSGNLPVRLVPGSTGTTIGGGNGNTGNGSTTPTTPTEPTTPAAEPIAAYIVCNTTVNVRSAAGVGNTLVTTLPNGTNVKIYEKTVEMGKEWARIDEGWVCMDYVRLGTLANVPNGGNNGNSGSVTIITTVPAGAIAVGYANEDIKIRSGSGLGYPEVATLKKGQSVAIYENKLDGGMSWGRTDNGWVCTSYLTITGIGVSGSGSMGTIARCGFTANVRGSASSNGALMAKVMISSRVAVHETTTVGAETWARTDLGWISMQYIVMDTETAPAPTVPDATTPTETTSVVEEGGEYVG